jgi:hypothetical protein
VVTIAWGVSLVAGPPVIYGMGVSLSHGCRHRSGWVPLFRSGGSRLSGCGVRGFSRCGHRPGVAVHFGGVGQHRPSIHSDGRIV